MDTIHQYLICVPIWIETTSDALPCLPPKVLMRPCHRPNCMSGFTVPSAFQLMRGDEWPSSRPGSRCRIASGISTQSNKYFAVPTRQGLAWHTSEPPASPGDTPTTGDTPCNSHTIPDVVSGHKRHNGQGISRKSQMCFVFRPVAGRLYPLWQKPEAATQVVSVDDMRNPMIHWQPCLLWSSQTLMVGSRTSTSFVSSPAPVLHIWKARFQPTG